MALFCRQVQRGKPSVVDLQVHGRARARQSLHQSSMADGSRDMERCEAASIYGVDIAAAKLEECAHDGEAAIVLGRAPDSSKGGRMQSSVTFIIGL